MTTSRVPVRPEKQLPEAQKAALTDLVEHILNSPWFRTSHRSSTLLRHTVEAAIEGRGDQLRERQIGIKAFHRHTGYDSDADPVVRIAAGDVRKRLAQYYGDPENAAQIQIELPVGSYVPVFHFPSQEEMVAPLPETKPSVASGRVGTNVADAPSDGGSAPPAALALQPPRSQRWRYAAIAVSALGLIGLSLYLSRTVVHRENRATEFWKPFRDPSGSTLICISDMASFKREFPWFSLAEGNLDGSAGAYIRTQDKIFLSDAINSTKLAVKISTGGSAYRLASSNMTNLTDLRQGPVILLGSFGNDWTMRVLESLRYGIEMRPKVGGVITDKQNPGQTNWVVSYAAPLEKFSVEYGVVARLRSSITEKPMMVIAGLSEPGTTAAEEVVTNPQYLEVLLNSAPTGWQNRNMEVVIETQVIEGKTGPPKVIATHIW
jgi:hypothetical protein